MLLSEYLATRGIALDSIKALSVRQPFAGLIVHGEKTVEWRSRPIAYRGPLVICASKSKAWLAKDDADFPRGVAVGIVDVVGCRAMTREDLPAACCEDYDGTDVTGFAWVLSAPRLCQPVPVKGIVTPWPWIARGGIDLTLLSLR